MLNLKQSFTLLLAVEFIFFFSFFLDIFFEIIHVFTAVMLYLLDTMTPESQFAKSGRDPSGLQNHPGSSFFSGSEFSVVFVTGNSLSSPIQI